MFWDEQDLMRAFYNGNTGTFQYYTYDDKGERAIKYGLDAPAQLYQNGAPVVADDVRMFEYKLYPDPYVTVSSTGQYTKHYFEGSKRFASRLMDGAVRFEDPSVLYTTKTAQDQGREKKADTEADFKKYLEKTGLGSDVSVELKEAYQRPNLYYLHGDHLGTATFVTNSQGEATQFFLNLPFGETMLEQMDGSYNNPYKFNAKELDDDTGLYYYGARYYNPRLSIWYGVDPLAVYNPVMETQFYGNGEHNNGVYNLGNLNPYIYCYQNPVRYIDPNGKQVDVTLFDINQTPSDSRLVKAGQKMHYVPNSFTIMAHGNVGYMRDVRDGKKIEGDAGQISNTKLFDARFSSYKEWNEGKNKKGFSLILYSCNTGGGGENSLPSKLTTDYKNLTVIAPTRQMWSSDNGFVGVYGATEEHKMDRSDPGYWLVFQKGKLVDAYDLTWEPGTSTKGQS